MGRRRVSKGAGRSGRDGVREGRMWKGEMVGKGEGGLDLGL